MPLGDISCNDNHGDGDNDIDDGNNNDDYSGDIL